MWVYPVRNAGQHHRWSSQYVRVGGKAGLNGQSPGSSGPLVTPSAEEHVDPRGVVPVGPDNAARRLLIFDRRHCRGV